MSENRANLPRPSATLVVALLGILALLGAIRAARAIEVGLIAPLSGPWARQGEVMKLAAELAIEKINRGGGITAPGGAPLHLAVFDAAESVEKAKNAAQRMVANAPNLVVATGAYLSSFTLAVTEVTERAGLPLVTFSYSDQITQRAFNYVFQTSATGDRQAEGSLPALMETAQQVSAKRPRKVAIVMDNTAASIAFIKPIKDHQLEKLGLKLAVDETFTPPLANATPLIQRLLSARPDLLLLLPTTISDAKLLLEKINEFGPGKGRLPTISNGAAILGPALRNDMDTAQLEGVMLVVANWSTSAQEDFVAEVTQKTAEPWPTQHFVTTYGDMWLFKAALEAAGSADRDAVAAALRAMDISGGPAAYFPGDGRLRFASAGRRIGAGLLIVQRQHGVPVTVFPSAVALAQPVWPKP